MSRSYIDMNWMSIDIYRIVLNNHITFENTWNNLKIATKKKKEKKRRKPRKLKNTIHQLRFQSYWITHRFISNSRVLNWIWWTHRIGIQTLESKSNIYQNSIETIWNNRGSKILTLSQEAPLKIWAKIRNLLWFLNKWRW